MEENEGVIGLHYLPKVLLQYENSPYLDNEDLVDASQHLPLVCSLDLCSGYVAISAWYHACRVISNTSVV